MFMFLHPACCVQAMLPAICVCGSTRSQVSDVLYLIVGHDRQTKCPRRLFLVWIYANMAASSETKILQTHKLLKKDSMAYQIDGDDSLQSFCFSSTPKMARGT